MANSLVKVTVTEVEGLSKRLGQLADEGLDQAITVALNAAATNGYNLVRPRMNEGIALEDAYILSNMTLELASPGKHSAAITALGNTLAGLSRYKPTQLGKRGVKGSGVAVTVARGGPQPLKSSKVFIAPNIRDSAGNPFVMRRLPGKTANGRTRMQRLLGPSVYQLFAHQLPMIEPELGDQLQEDLLDAVQAQFQKEFL